MIRLLLCVALGCLSTVVTACSARTLRFEIDLAKAATGPAKGEKACIPEAGKPSCFYREDPTGKTPKLIVLIHGVLGGGATSWGDPTQETFWPAMIAADGRFVDFDIYIVNYLTPLLQTAPDIYETASNELSVIENRGLFSRYGEIHFIAHSMGGLIVKNMLVKLRSSLENQKLRRAKSVVFLATPAQGANIATLGAWFSSNPQFRGMEPAHLNESIKKLEDDWVRFLRARDGVRARFPRIHCAYETLPTATVLVVPREMAASRCDSDLQAMPFNHSGLARPTGRDVNPYLWAMAKISEASDEVASKRRANQLVAQGGNHLSRAQYSEALRAFREARGLYKAVDDRQGEADVLIGLGDLELARGRNDAARAAYTEAQILYKAEESRLGEAHALRGLGHLMNLAESTNDHA